MEKTNAKTTDLTGATVLAGDQDVKGVEFGLSGNITPRWGAFGGLSLMDGEGQELRHRHRKSARSSPYVPQVSLNLWSTYRLPMGLTLGGGANYSERQLLQPDRRVPLRRRRHRAPTRSTCQNAAAIQALTKYWMFNAVAIYQLNKHLLLQVNGYEPGEREVRGSRLRSALPAGPDAAGRCSAPSSRCEAARRRLVLLQIPDVLNAEQVAHARRLLDAADWVDGRVTAGRQSAQVKDNLQLPEDHPVAHELGDLILTALQHSPLFASAALPLRVFPPLFNLYRGGHSFGNHVDNAIRQIAGTPLRIRTDLSATLFLAEPDEYDGGELIVEDTYGVHAVKLPAGHMVLYPSSSLHRVQPVTRGARLASFFWVQSMVRDDAARTVLFDLDTSIQRLSADVPDHPSVVQLTAVYHNLVRRWADL